MTIQGIINSRPEYTDELFLGEIIIRDKVGFVKQSESFFTRKERKELNDKFTKIYHEKLKYRGWTLSILLQ